MSVVDAKDAPDGYYAVASEMCAGCAFDTGRRCSGFPFEKRPDMCSNNHRKDGIDVIFLACSSQEPIMLSRGEIEQLYQEHCTQIKYNSASQQYIEQPKISCLSETDFTFIEAVQKAVLEKNKE